MTPGETTVTLNHAQLQALRALAERGAAAAAASLSEMVGQPVELRLTEVREVPIARAHDLLGAPEQEVTAIYVGFQGGLCGHVALILDLSAGLELVDLLMGQPVGETTKLDEMGLSALAEVGNLTSSFFVNTLADALGVTVHVTPPAVAQDMAAAVISAIAAEVGALTEVLIALRTEFTIGNRAVSGEFFVLPEPDSLNLITRGMAG